MWGDKEWMKTCFDHIHLSEHQRVNHFRNHFEVILIQSINQTNNNKLPTKSTFQRSTHPSISISVSVVVYSLFKLQLTRKDNLIKNLKRTKRQLEKEDKPTEVHHYHSYIYIYRYIYIIFYRYRYIYSYIYISISFIPICIVYVFILAFPFTVIIIGCQVQLLSPNVPSTFGILSLLRRMEETSSWNVLDYETGNILTQRVVFFLQIAYIILSLCNQIGKAQGKGIFLFNKLSQISNWKKDYSWTQDQPQVRTVISRSPIYISPPNRQDSNLYSHPVSLYPYSSNKPNRISYNSTWRAPI